MLNAIVALADEPRPVGVRKLVGSESDWRIRVGEYRVVYEIDEKANKLTVMRVAHRRDVYR
jgi:mRNA interferase RelE/StbE